LLFDYLEQAELILPYTNKDKAVFAYYLTGHSKDKIRADKGFGVIESIRKDREKPKEYNEVEFYNLKTVKNHLKGVIKMINRDIERFSEK
jgi:hypothetical protein